MKKHPESHLDHGLNQAQIDYLFTRFADKREFFIETIELPPELGTVPCGLWGPAMGDPEMLDGQLLFLPPGQYIVDRLPDPANIDGAITMAKRGARGWESRLINAPMRPTRKLTIIAGPHEEHACILYTCYGGPQAPQEPTDPKISAVKLDEAKAFWAVHALSRYAS